MAKFVNYKKRNITLPAGCKNLSDLLPKAKSSTPRGIIGITHGGGQDEPPPTDSRNWSVTGKLTDMADRVAPVFASHALCFSLDVRPSDQEPHVDVYRTGDGETCSSITVQMGTDREKAVRDFLTRHGLRVPIDSGIPASFNPNLPVHHFYELLPPPGEMSQLTAVLVDLFREVFGLTDESELSFDYQEITLRPDGTA